MRFDRDVPFPAPPAGTGPPTAAELLACHPGVDLHAHPGGRFRIGWRGLELSLDEARMERRIAQMTAGGVAVVSIAVVPDASALGVAGWTLRARRPLRAGEGYDNLRAQLAPVQRRIERGILFPVLEPEQVQPPGDPTRHGVMMAVEGADFLDGRLERLAEVRALGVRSVQLLHYADSGVGDIQTGPPRYGGLTDFGREMVRELNRLGLIVDVAHATCETCRQVVAVSTRPVLLSHTMIGHLHARQISAEHARLIGSAGGVVGAWGLWGRRIGLAGYVRTIRRLVAAAGIDHVGIGTDVDGFPLSLGQYRHWTRMVQALLDGGFTAEETAKIVGGNFLRLFHAVRHGQADAPEGP